MDVPLGGVSLGGAAAPAPAAEAAHVCDADAADTDADLDCAFESDAASSIGDAESMEMDYNSNIECR